MFQEDLHEALTMIKKAVTELQMQIAPFSGQQLNGKNTYDDLNIGLSAVNESLQHCFFIIEGDPEAEEGGDPYALPRGEYNYAVEAADGLDVGKEEP